MRYPLSASLLRRDQINTIAGLQWSRQGVLLQVHEHRKAISLRQAQAVQSLLHGGVLRQLEGQARAADISRQIAVQAELYLHGPRLSERARHRFSEERGSVFTRTPVALAMALAIAAGGGMPDGSPTPLAP